MRIIEAMDLLRSASVLLSARGRCRGDCPDPVAAAAALVGEMDGVPSAAQVVAGPWLDSGGLIVGPEDSSWPQGLEALGPAAPLLLWVLGDLADVDPAVAIVGSRECTGYGTKVAGDLARVVALAGAWVVSGGAIGIDEAAHRGALDGHGRTLLCAAGGAGCVYPAGHASLFDRVRESGALVWEFPPGMPLSKRGFLHRNRLISALAATTVLVEAAVRSGALNTGRTSADLGRLVLGVPGPMNSPVSAGVHTAIADGWATILLGAQDLLELAALRVERV